MSGSRSPALQPLPSNASVRPCTLRKSAQVRVSVTAASYRCFHVAVTTMAHLWAYSSSTLLSPVTALDSCLQRAARSPTSIAWFISTTDDSISTATSSSGWDSDPWQTSAQFLCCNHSLDKDLFLNKIKEIFAGFNPHADIKSNLGELVLFYAMSRELER